MTKDIERLRDFYRQLAEAGNPDLGYVADALNFAAYQSVIHDGPDQVTESKVVFDEQTGLKLQEEIVEFFIEIAPITSSNPPSLNDQAQLFNQRFAEQLTDGTPIGYITIPEFVKSQIYPQSKGFHNKFASSLSRSGIRTLGQFRNLTDTAILLNPRRRNIGPDCIRYLRTALKPKQI